MTKSNAALTGKGEQRCDREGAAVATQLHRDARLVGAGAAEEIASLDPVAYPNLQCGKMSDEGRPAGAVIDDHDAAIVPEISCISDAAVAWGHDSGARVGGDGAAERIHARVRYLAHAAPHTALDPLGTATGKAQVCPYVSNTV